MLRDGGINNAEDISKRVKDAFTQYANWKESEKDLRELRNEVTFAVCAEEDDIDKVTTLVEYLFTLLAEPYRS